MCSVGKAKDQPLVPGSHDLEHFGFIDLLVVVGGRGLFLGGKYSEVQLPSPGSLLLVKFTETMETS